jgi:uncharacterized protein (TIGR02246 family)
MKNAIVTAALAMAMACQSAPEIDFAAEEQAVAKVMNQINAAWESEDLEVFARLVAHDADMVNFGADANDRWVGWEGLEAGLRQQFEVFSDTKVTPGEVDIHVSRSGNVAWLAQAMSMSMEFLGSPMTLEARITCVFERRGADWRLVQFHYSVPMSESMRMGM